MKAPDALREAALHPRPERILGFERGRLLTLARSLDRLVVHLRPDRALPWGVFRGGAYLAGRTGATGGPVKPDPKHRIAGDIVPGRPLDTRMPLGTVRRLRLPIQDKGLQVIAVCDLMLPAVGPKGRPDHIDLMLPLGGDEEVGIHVTTVEQMGAREQITCGEVLYDDRAHCTIGRGRRGREHLGDQIRVLRLTRLGEGVLIADPLRVALRAVAGLQLVGRGDPQRRWRLLIRGTPTERFEPGNGTTVILLHPDLPERLQRGEGAEVRHACGRPHAVQELIAVHADLAGARFALARLFWQAHLIRSETVAVVPLPRYPLLHPCGSSLTQLVQGRMHGFQDTLQPVEGADGCQNMRGIRSLGATGFDPAARFAGGQERSEETLGGVMRQQPLAELVQQGEVKARVMQVEAEGIFPLHAASHGIRRLAVGEPFDILHHHD